MYPIIEEYKEKLCILENLMDDPSLFLTHAKEYSIPENRYIHSVYHEHENALDILNKFLLKIPAMENCRLVYDQYSKDGKIHIFATTIKHVNNKQRESDDRIMIIDTMEKKCIRVMEGIDDIQELMDAVPKVPVKQELSPYWLRFENLTISKRIKNAKDSIKRKDVDISVRIFDFFFHLFSSKKVTAREVEREKGKLQKRYEIAMEIYAMECERKEHYEKYGDVYKEYIVRKQQSIEDWLKKEYGYVSNANQLGNELPNPLEVV